MKYKLLFLLAIFSTGCFAQSISVKNNLLYDATLTPNLAIEVSSGKKWTIDIMAGLNPFSFADGNRKFKHWLVQPELRYWMCDKFNGHFFGLHAHGGQFNVSDPGIYIGRLSKLKHHRYEGWLIGGGLTYGYQWLISPRWGVEAAIGAGYAYIDYRKYECGHCGRKQAEGKTHYFGITKAAVSLIYIIK